MRKCFHYSFLSLRKKNTASKKYTDFHYLLTYTTNYFALHKIGGSLLYFKSRGMFAPVPRLGNLIITQKSRVMVLRENGTPFALLCYYKRISVELMGLMQWDVITCYLFKAGDIGIIRLTFEMNYYESCQRLQFHSAFMLKLTTLWR